ncbi:MAG TPA: selenocysteine-specific translation elongation factor, partial [Gammaproteobacteria bacterium]
MLIGTAGHIDHGKTTLVRALTGVDADRLPQEKQRGITLDLGYAYTSLPDGPVLGFVDVPGHEKLIRNMLAGATAIDFALLVIAADDGPMPQTREHLELLDLLGIQRGAVALTKCDAVPPERLEAVRGEIAHLLAGSGLANCPLFEVSAPSGMGMAALREHLQTAAADYTRPPAGSGFRLAIDRSFSLSGVGTVVTGTALSGKVRVGDTLTLSPPGLSARVRSLHVQDREAEQGTAGERCALAVKGDFDKKDIERGMWLVGDGLAHPLNRFQVELRVPAAQKALKHMQSVHVHIGSDDIMGRVALLEGKHLEPGGNMLAEI